MLAMQQIKGQTKRRLQPGNSVGCSFELLLLFMGCMWSVIGSDAINRTVEQSLPHRLAIGFSPQRRVYLWIGVVLPHLALGKHEVMRRHLTGYVQAIAPGLAHCVERRSRG